MRIRDRQKAVALLLGSFLLVTPFLADAAQAGPVPVRGGEHPDRGRVVFDWPDRAEYRIEEADGRVIVHFAPHADFHLPDKLPRNVLDLRIEPDGVSLALREGTRLRTFRLGNRVVLDLIDPPNNRRSPLREAATPPPALAHPAAPPVGTTLPPAAANVGHPVAAAGPVAAGPPGLGLPSNSAASGAPAVEAVESQTSPARRAEPPAAPSAVQRGVTSPPPALPPANAVALRLVPLPDGGRAVAMRLPAEAGLAVLRRGDAILAVIDTALPLDTAALRGDPVLGAADVLQLPEATVLRFRLAAPATLAVTRDGDTWRLEPRREPAVGRTIALQAEDGSLVLRAARPARVVAIADPETGLPLLVGAVSEPAQAVSQARRMPQAELLPTALGVALLARGDAVSLRPGVERFVLGGAGEGTAPASGLSGEAASMTRLFDLPALDPVAAQNRLRDQQAALAAAAPLQRAALRRDAAETMLALGLGQEAQAMLRLNFQEDPRAGLDGRVRALQAAAALLAGRLPEAAALRDNTLPPSDEVVLWRSLARAAAGKEAEAAPGLAATLPLLLAYPAPLRDRLAPRALEALLAGREAAAARRLLAALPDIPGAAEAKARLLEAEGKTDEALAAYDEASREKDRPSRARAIRGAAELRLRSGKLDAAGAAKAMEPAIFAWRDEDAEFDTRMRVAALRLQGGAPRDALALLAETRTLFPDRAAALRAPMTAALVDALRREPPLEAVALADANRELMPTDEGGSEAFTLLADRLAALDLSDRAAAVLTRVMAGTTGTPRAALGARLAALRLDLNDVAGAASVLSDSDAPDLATPLADRRALLNAQILARQNRLPEAEAALRAMGPAGLEPLAALLAQNRDWAGATEALSTLAEQPGAIPGVTTADAPVPGTPAAKDTLSGSDTPVAVTPEDTPDAPGEARRRIVARAAAFAALSGDARRSVALRRRWSGKMGDGASAQALEALTRDPVRAVAELPRWEAELNLFRGFPGRLEPLRTDAASSR
ncbi:hypothetical protein [Roseomonas elaeocarpi]|uniref:Uncharacterized protein n=1 Tax=Roseomonas elaeocarpi TaxID=907779 RepID=A0ABV6JP71_9PROT